MKKSILVLAIISFFTVTTIILGGYADVSSKPDKPNPNEAMMNMLEDIYDIVLDTNLKVEGILIQKTGQTTRYATGDDGDLEKGYEWPDPRFFDNGDGTVTDYLTGLIWLKDASCLQGLWAAALTECNTLNSGECSLTDGSFEGDWRLPNIRELQSLIDYSQSNPALPSGHPFEGVRSDDYW